jgi:hypothetical protein
MSGTERDAGAGGRSLKKPYEPPKVTQVPLRPEEAVLGACKVAAGGGPGGTCGVTCATSGS